MLEQIDERFAVVVAHDGSTDGSRALLRDLEAE
jgi:hypothetical protein